MTEPSKKRSKGNLQRQGIKMLRAHALENPHQVIHWMRQCYNHRYKAMIRVDQTLVHLIYHAPKEISDINSAPEMDFLCIPDCGPDAVVEKDQFEPAEGPIDLLTYVNVVMTILAMVKANKVVIPPINFTDFELNW